MAHYDLGGKKEWVCESIEITEEHDQCHQRDFYAFILLHYFLLM